MVDHRKGRGSEELLEAANLKQTTNFKRRNEKAKPKENRHRGRAAAGTLVAATAVVLLGITVYQRIYMPNRAKTVSGSVAEETVSVQVVEGTVAANSEQSSTDGTSVSDAADSMSKRGQTAHPERRQTHPNRRRVHPNRQKRPMSPHQNVIPSVKAIHWQTFL